MGVLGFWAMEIIIKVFVVFKLSIRFDSRV
jgi:hypothetical protein